MSCANLSALAKMSNKYGSDSNFVLAGGGNTSFKDEKYLYIKGSGSPLATIQPEDFVVMDRAALATIWSKQYSDNTAVREAEVLADMMDARRKDQTRRPSVETMLHDLLDWKFILHVHPAVVNGITCAVNGAETVARLFPNAIWVPCTEPGYILAMKCLEIVESFKEKNGQCPNLIFLENHGVFFAADTTDDVDVIVAEVMDRIKAEISEEPDFTEIPYDADKVAAIAPVLRMLAGNGKAHSAIFCTNPAILNWNPCYSGVTPDHIVYCKALALVLSDGDDIASALDAFRAANGYTPRIVYYRGLGVFALGETLHTAKTALSLYLDEVSISVYAKSFGGVSMMPAALTNFIVNWEAESYRSKVSLAGNVAKRLDKKVSIVTGAAQGFGLGIAEEMAREGAYVVIADMNYEGAKAVADRIPNAMAVAVNVTDEASVKDMVNKVVATYGGLDIFVNNAGIVKAGSLKEMQKGPFEFVTAVNYTGYFLCAKYASAVMQLQHSVAPNYMMDIIQINSKSGLEGSNKNFAYAGSKFGGIGLTASFALELAPYNIKVNSICPGNFLNGPLWSDPEKGLFVQYLRAGKVPGAKTVEDVRKFYESKVPLGRGCETIDVARAIMYIVEQEYETGQAIPVTGGQIMLH